MSKFYFRFTLTENKRKNEFIINANSQLSLEGEIARILCNFNCSCSGNSIGQASLVQFEGAPLVIKPINISDLMKTIQN